MRSSYLGKLRIVLNITIVLNFLQNIEIIQYFRKISSGRHNTFFACTALSVIQNYPAWFSLLKLNFSHVGDYKPSSGQFNLARWLSHLQQSFLAVGIWPLTPRLTDTKEARLCLQCSLELISIYLTEVYIFIRTISIVMNKKNDIFWSSRCKWQRYAFKSKF